MHGRAQEQWLIRQRLRTVSHGHNGLIILEGARGSGKTELLRQVSVTAAQSGFAVMNGPFGDHKRLLLAAALTDRADHPPAPESTGRAPHSGTDLLDGILATELGYPAASEARPVLVALDDVAWDDPDVRAALARLPLPGTAHRVLWLLSGTGGPAPQTPLHHPGTDRVTLGPLRRRDALRLAADRLDTARASAGRDDAQRPTAGGPGAAHETVTAARGEDAGPGDETVGALVEACGGHPALLVAVLDRLVADRAYPGTGGPLPPRILTALLREDPRLSARTRGLLRTVATRPRPVRTRELVNLPHGRAVPLLGSVREATEAGVLVMDGDRLAFRHALLRRAAALLPPRDTPPPPGPGTGPDTAAAAGPEDETGNLSPREDAIVRLVAQGLTNSQIATRVNLSPHTVNFHLRKIFRKLGVSSRVELVGTRLRTTTRPPTQESRAAHAG
ncbi:MAG TPA: LuxR family transcriptional regulator [Streptomyces sp.]|nr:LuxR family transcriptional regulator [Streptomyces sp.]